MNPLITTFDSTGTFPAQVLEIPPVKNKFAQPMIWICHLLIFLQILSTVWIFCGIMIDLTIQHNLVLKQRYGPKSSFVDCF